MKIALLAEVIICLGIYVLASGEASIVITKNGRPVTAIMNSANEHDLHSLMSTQLSRFQKLLTQANKGISRRGGIPMAASSFPTVGTPPRSGLHLCK